MKASRLIFALLLASSVAVVQLAAQQTKADQKPLEEVKGKAEAGEAESQVELGRCYEKGQGVAKDQVEAAKWYRKAAEQNFARAQNNLGVCYEKGEGVAKAMNRWFFIFCSPDLPYNKNSEPKNKNLQLILRGAVLAV